MPPKRSPKLVIYTNLNGMNVSELKNLANKYKIKDISGSGIGGKLIKPDYITAIKDYEVQKIGKKGSPITIKTKTLFSDDTHGVSSKLPPKQKSPNGQRIPGVEKLTASQVLDAMRAYNEYEHMSDYQIKKAVKDKMGISTVPKVADLRMELMVLRGTVHKPSSPKKKVDEKVDEKIKSKEVKRTFADILASLKCEPNPCKNDQYCNTENRKCISKTKTGKVWGEKKLREDYGDDYFVDEKRMLVGRKKNVKAHAHKEQPKDNRHRKEKELPKTFAEALSRLKCDPNPCGKKEFCNASTGRCAKVKKGKLEKEKKYKKRYGEDFLIDKENRLFGKKSDVIAHHKGEIPTEQIPSQKPKTPKKKSPKKIKTPLPPPKKKKISPKKREGQLHEKCGEVGMKNVTDYTTCSKGEICNIYSGKCVSDTDSNRRGLTLLRIEGREIAGTEEHIKSLQSVLGGDIIYDEKASKSPAPMKIEEKSKVEIPPDTAASREKIEETFRKCLSGEMKSV